jgi:hypothetical protein
MPTKLVWAPGACDPADVHLVLMPSKDSLDATLYPALCGMDAAPVRMSDDRGQPCHDCLTLADDTAPTDPGPSYLGRAG